MTNELEPIRLVIWDLDETFWKGTLSEGGIAYIPEYHDIVIELARRGIMSSICSKNDRARTEQVLKDRGIWEYFIFPSIDWRPKGPRIAALIESVQLRAPTVLFIDDSRANLEEARYCAPGLQTASEEFVPRLLEDPRFAGKRDEALSRLAQYRVLEARATDAQSFSGHNHEFLRSSGIRLTIELDVEGNLDRAIEIVNRTNQLNFTKKRLPENLDEAREELRGVLRQFSSHAGLLRLADRYGDYGWIGFFLCVGSYQRSRLEHFCFSCRTLNMGLESWTYQWLGCPAVRRLPGVDYAFIDDPQEVDWISVTNHEASDSQRIPPKILDRLVLRGGCDLSAMSHYLAPLAHDYHVETNTARDDRQFRIDNAIFLNHVFEEPSVDVQSALGSIGYVPSDWRSALSLPMLEGTRNVWIFSFWTDAFVQLYRHRSLNVAAPFLLESEPHAAQDVIAMDAESLAGFLTQEAHRSAYAALKERFSAIGPLDDVSLRTGIERVAQAAADRVLVFVMLAPEYFTEPGSGVRKRRTKEAEFNARLRTLLADRPNFHLIDILDHLAPGAASARRFSFRQIDLQASCRSHNGGHRGQIRFRSEIRKPKSRD